MASDSIEEKESRSSSMPEFAMFPLLGSREMGQTYNYSIQYYIKNVMTVHISDYH